MEASAQSVEGAPAGIGKKDLAQALRWSRPTLDKRLKSDPHFPVLSTGDQAGGWSFDLVAVLRHLDGKPAKIAAPPPTIDLAQLRDTVLPPPSRAPTVRVARRSAHHQGEASARQRKDAADAALRENKLRQENAELVERSQLRQELTDLFVALGADLDALPEEIAKQLDLPDAAPRIRDMIDKARTDMVERAGPMLADD